MVVVGLGFLVLLAGHFTLDRAGITVAILNDPRFVALILLLAALAFESANQHLGALVSRRARACLSAVLAFYAYQLTTALWADSAARVPMLLGDLAALIVLVAVYWTLAQWDRDRVVAMTLGCVLVAAAVYFLAAASGHGHDQSGRWAALGGGPNVFVRIMFLGVFASIYFYCRSGRTAWLIPAPPLLAGAVFSGSRGGMLAGAAVVVLAVLPILRRLRMARLVSVLAASAVLATLTWVVVGDRIAAVVDQRFITVTLENGYTAERDVIFLRAVELFLDHPLLGVGLDGFYAHTNLSFGYEYAHSLPLSVAAEGGVLGLAMLLFACFALYRGYAAVPARERSLECRAAAYCGIFIGVSSLFSGHYYDARLMWVFLILAAATPPPNEPDRVALAATKTLTPRLARQ